MNINKLLKDFPRLLERLEHLERVVGGYPTGDVVGPCICGSWPGGKCLRCTRVDTGTQVPVTLAPAVSERSQAVTQGAGIGETGTRNRRGSTRRN
jgi:hypothetical protein